MGYVQKMSEELFDYKPPLTRRADFDEFWEQTIARTKDVPLNPRLKQVAYPSPLVEVFEISYNGFDETRIHGWFIVPTFTGKEKVPCLIHYHGFGANAGVPSDFMPWISLGVAVLSVDCREQSGRTGNCARYSSGSAQNVVTKGLLDKNEYYFRAVYMDCLKAIDFACEQEVVDSSRIILEGASQGGALVMAVSALDDRPYLALADVPSNSDLEQRVAGGYGAFAGVAGYLKLHLEQTDRVLETLSYFDTMNMAERISCKVLASVGLKDNICPPRCYFATYNRITGEKQIKIYPFNGHEGGGAIHREEKMRFIKDNL